MRKEDKRRDHEKKERRERHENKIGDSREHLKGKQSVGRKQKGVFGREHDMGIAEWDAEAEKGELTPLTNRFSKIHDCSMEEAMRFARGRGSYQMED